jgi:hypothetical protein
MKDVSTYFNGEKDTAIYNNAEVGTLKGKKFDNGKTRWDKFPWLGAEEVMKVMAFGAKKYDWDNWRGGMYWTRLVSAAIRHLVAYLLGEKLDPETGLSHFAHAATNCLFLAEYFVRGTPEDDVGES